jgi:hypothetical protein
MLFYEEMFILTSRHESVYRRPKCIYCSQLDLNLLRAIGGIGMASRGPA